MALRITRFTLSLAVLSLPTLAPARELTFERDVGPIFRSYCWKCHGLEGRFAALDLRTLPIILEGGKSGPVLVPGSAAKSLLYRVLVPGPRQEEHFRAMKAVQKSDRQYKPRRAIEPPPGRVRMIGAWIDEGARAISAEAVLTPEQSPTLSEEDRQWWSFRKPVRPAVPIPAAGSRRRVRGPVDAFLLARLEDKGLPFSEDASPEVLVRRLYLDLLGFPPTPEEIDDYVEDDAPDRCERTIDRLLASPHYGERWGRHWLDAAGYTDVMGGDDLITSTWMLKGIWRYRDYVIRSYNEDKPLDRFLREQIAGDELVEWRDAETFTPEIRDHLVATGFLRLARDQTFEEVSDTAVHRENTIVEMLTSFGTNVLGLTIQCAQCHSHKYEPVSQVDYYRLRSLFAPAYDPQNWKHSWGDKIERDKPLPDPDSGRFQRVVSAREYALIRTRNAAIDRQIAPLEAQLAAIEQEAREEVLAEKLERIPRSLRADTKAALAAPEAARTRVQAYLVEKLAALLEVTDDEVTTRLDDEGSRESAELATAIAELEDGKERPELIQALWDVGPPPRQYVLTRGDYERPGVEVTPGVPGVLDDPTAPFVLPARKPGVRTSGYRTALARWLGRDDHPLTARVFVNRVWQRYFDRGIVETMDNLGRSGALPSHPELLDWLATEFVASGWRLKWIHRHILMSTAYRQMTSPPRDSRGHEVDPENRLFWKMPLRRLDSEVIRDSILAVSGELDLQMGGHPVVPLANDDGATLSFKDKSLPDPADRCRRSVYVVARRNYHLTILQVFDQPILAANCTQRKKSAVVLQSLALLNDEFAQKQAEYLARRVRRRGGDSGVERIRTAFRLALGRAPAPAETAASLELLDKQIALHHAANAALEAREAADRALIDLCHMLLNTNEFLYIK